MSEPAAARELVVIGASAGGIDALSRLLATLPTAFPAPIVIAQHLDPQRVSHLREILARRSALPVRTVTEDERLRAGLVYVVPSNCDVEITDHAIHVRADGPRRPKPSIDRLLTSAADHFGERLIAVILTGTGSDGAEGARQVSAAGGTVVVQNPATARFSGLPASLAPTTVDVVAELERIGPLLYDLLTGAYRPPSTGKDDHMRTLLEEVMARTGIDFSAYRQPTIHRRLRRRMAETGTPTIEAYTQYLHRHPEEYQRLAGSFLIKVTDFFRDAELFERLRERVLPELVEEARANGNELRLWSAGCATGEEAYSLAILVADLLGDELEEFSVRIFATDIDPDAVAYARRGIYPVAALETLPPDLRSRYFTDVDGYQEIRKRVRQIVVFASHDLGQRAPFPRIDLVLCRNVLIYFTPELQRRALQMFAFSLRPGGRLVLGKSETTSPLPEHFILEDSKRKIFRRQIDRIRISPADVKGATPGPSALAPSHPELIRAEFGLARAHEAHRMPRTRSEEAERLLLDLPVGVVVVDRQYDVHAINPTARRLLSIHSAAIGEDLIHLARRVPADPLRNVIDQAFAGRSASVQVEVQPLGAPPGGHRLLEMSCFPRAAETTVESVATVALLVSDVTPVDDALPAVGPPRPPEQEEIARVLSQLAALPDIAASTEARLALDAARAALETALAGLDRLADQNRALDDTKRELLVANRELTATNAELRGHNEELILANEEAQAAMEEVETLSEEQQASNEELETLNEELQATIEELNTTNDDLEGRGLELQETAISLETERSRLAAILASLADAVLVIDEAGRPVQTNGAFEELFADVGVDFVPEDEHGHALPPEAWPHRRAAAGETFTMQFTRRATDGTRRWYEASARPIQHGRQGGGVIVIRDITDRSLLRLQNEFLAMASHELRTPLTALHGYLQLHRRQLEAGADTEALLKSATTASLQVQRMSILVNDLLDTTRLQSGRLQLRPDRLDLVSLVQHVIDLVRPLTRDQTIRLDLPSSPVLVNGDPVRLEQVVWNLLTNAIAHAPDTERIDVSLRVAGDTAELEVQDAGPGIPPVDLDRLFSRFAQGAGAQHARSSGLGLGLYISKEIVTGHGGTISVDSSPGVGTRFTVRLPLLPADTAG